MSENEYGLNQERQEGLERLRQKTKDKIEVDVKVKNESLEQALSKLAEVESERDDYKDKLVLIAEREFERKKEELGCDDPSIDDPIKLMAWEAGRKGRQGEGAGSGNVPLENQRLGEGSEQGFSDYGEMMRHLENLESLKGTPQSSEAKKVLDIFIERSLKAIKEKPNQSHFSVELKEPLKDYINKRFRERRKIMKELVDDEQK
jgi:hypothetical protein